MATPDGGTFSIKNFERYQHYKTRNPTWVKLYYSLLDDPEFIALSTTARSYYMMLLMVASQQNNVIRNDPDYLMKVMRISEKPDLTPLFDSGFLLASRKHRASTLLVPCKQNAMPEESRVEKRREEPPTPLHGFDDFWTVYPRKLGKADALKAWKKLNPDSALLQTVLDALSKALMSPDWTKDAGQFIPHPATWLRGRRWEDEIQVTTLPPPTRPRLTALQIQDAHDAALPPADPEVMAEIAALVAQADRLKGPPERT